MWTGNAMRLKAQQDKIMKTEDEYNKITWLGELIREKLNTILMEIASSSEWDTNISLRDFLIHIQKPKGYTIDIQRGYSLDAILLSTWLPIWYIDGKPIAQISKISQWKVGNDIILAVKRLLDE